VLAIRLALKAYERGDEAIRLLDYVARDGWALNRAAGEGRKWSQALEWLRLGLAVARPIIGVA
jgi:hypothetical protein